MFTLNREALAHELSLLNSAAETKGTIPILAFVLIEVDQGKAKLTATDLDIFITAEIAAEGDGWSGCIPFRQLHDFVKLLDKTVESVLFEPNETRIEVKANRSKMKVPIEPVDRFPQPQPKPNRTIKIDGEWLLPAIQRIIASADREDGSLNLSGVNMECGGGMLAVVTTDKHRMSFAEIPCEAEPFKLFLPRAATGALTKLISGETEIAFDDSIAYITNGPRVLVSRLLVVQFPQWRMVIPKAPRYTAQAVTGEIQAAIRRASVTLDGSGSRATRDAIRLRFSAKGLSVETQETDKGYSEESVEIESNMNGDSVLIGFDQKYILDALASVGEQVEISFTDALSQARIKPLNSESVTHVVMPRRL